MNTKCNFKFLAKMIYIVSIVYNLNGYLTINNNNSLNSHFLIHHFLDLVNNGVVIIGRKSWFSLDITSRNLIRSAIVLTNDKTLYNQSTNSVKFTNYTNMKTNPNTNYFVCGGIDIIKQFMKKNVKYYFTVLENFSLTEKDESYIKIPLKYDLVINSVSEKLFDKDYNLYFRLLGLVQSNKNTHYQTFFEHYRTLVDNNLQTDYMLHRLGTSLEFDISNHIPLIGNIDWKVSINKVIDNLRGNTTNIDSSDKTGWNWRFFGADYSSAFSDTTKINRSAIGGIDQLKLLDNKIKNGDGKGFIFSCNPKDVFQMDKIPRMISCQFLVSEQRYLSISVFLSRSDCLLELPSDCFEYSIMLYILSKRYNLKPKNLSICCGDLYILKGHTISILETCTPSPFLTLNNSIQFKTMDEIDINDFTLIGLNKN